MISTSLSFFVHEATTRREDAYVFPVLCFNALQTASLLDAKDEFVALFKANGVVASNA